MYTLITDINSDKTVLLKNVKFLYSKRGCLFAQKYLAGSLVSMCMEDRKEM